MWIGLLPVHFMATAIWLDLFREGSDAFIYGPDERCGGQGESVNGQSVIWEWAVEKRLDVSALREEGVHVASLQFSLRHLNCA